MSEEPKNVTRLIFGKQHITILSDERNPRVIERPKRSSPCNCSVISMPAKGRRSVAYKLYQRAMILDENPTTVDEAERLYKEVIQLDPWLDLAYTNLGKIKYDYYHDLQSAREWFQKAISINPKQAEALYNLGHVLNSQGDNKQAILLLLDAIALDPSFADAHYNLAVAYDQIGDYRQARPYWESFIELSRKNQSVDRYVEHAKMTLSRTAYRF